MRNGKIDSVGDFTPNGLMKLIQYLQPWFRDKIGIGGHVIQDEGVDLPQQPNLNFVGAGVTATDDPPDTTLVTIPGVTPGVPTLGDSILALTGLGSFWKLNESTGLVAADSGPNGYDLTAATAPAWGQAAGPPGEQSAGFIDSGTLVRPSRTGISMLGAGDMTVLIFAYRGDNSENAVIGSGDPDTTNRGWIMSMEAVNRNTHNKATFQVGNTVLSGEIEGTTNLTVDAWHFLVATHASGTWHLYVNGVEEGTPITTVMSAPAVPDYWMAVPNGGSSHGLQGRLSYGAVLNRALSAAEVSNLQDIAGLLGQAAAGMVYTNPGSGGTPYWAYPVTTWVDGV